ncbi:MAG: hypothetical protein IM584_07050 [Chitinophagaceae bacterium]|nr:hypothetical protein [Chitinophagaceae bacterium]MCA6453490.1 hypothetical protein [Chitinophagaceae bacterium]MCA6455879.1 hypothetical protein [Chitinophagaceae bacterium]MCA6458227.1 hypothetical protein [Chitinophagaceae bacterium]MCA6463939.1 hypothetical protein [Chitinophagaceae bacterium]
MVFLFRDKSIANLFFLVVLSIAVHLHLFINAPLVVTNDADGVFSILLRNYVVGLPTTVLFLLYHIIVLTQAIRLNIVLNDLRMFQHNTYTTAMAYVLLTGLFTQWCSITPALLANFLLIWLFIKLCRLYNHPSPKTLLFNTGLIVGLSVLCYHPTAILVLVVLFALAVVRPFKLAEWLTLLMGALLPYYFLGAILFLKDQFGSFSQYLPYLKLNLPLQEMGIPLMVSLSLLFLFLVTGLYYWQASSNRMVIQVRKNWGVMAVMLFILLPIPFLFHKAGLESGLMLLVPLGAFAGNGFSYPRSLILPNILFWLTAGLIAYNNWWMVYYR